MRVLVDKEAVARKDHRCDACETYRRVGYGKNEFSGLDRKTIDDCEKDGFMIKAKTKYRRLVYEDGGDIITFKARLDMDRLCQEFGFYDD